MALFQAALVDLFFGEETQTETRKWSVRYLRSGCLRAYFDRAHGQLNGEFLIFYPDGKLWMKGGCRDDELIESTLQLFLPNGDLARGQPPNGNVIPFRGCG
jgi:hypothetical protein